MRITFIIDRLNLGGAERHALNLSRALWARGHDIQVIVLFSGGSDNFPLSDFPVTPVRLEAGGLFSPHIVTQLSDTLSEWSPDTVFAINQSALFFATLARVFGKFQKARLLCIFHTTEINSLPGRIKVHLFKWCTARADALIFVSCRQRDYWVSRGMRSNAVMVIHNGIDTDYFAPSEDAIRAAMRERLGFSEQDLVVTLVGRLAPEKNHSWLLRTLAKLRRNEPNAARHVRLVFIGEGSERPRLEAETAALGLGEVVVFAGSHRDIRPVLAVADVGALVSNAVETFSLAALEFMSNKTPMIMTEIGGASEIIVSGEHGYLIPKDDDTALMQALLALHDKERRHMMGLRARERVICNFSFGHMVDQYQAIALGTVDTEGHSGD